MIIKENPTSLKKKVAATSRRLGSAWWSLLGLLLVSLVGLVGVVQSGTGYSLNIGTAQPGQELNNFYDLEQSGLDRRHWAYPVAQVQLRPLDSHLKICLQVEEITTGRQMQLALLYDQTRRVNLQNFQLEPGLHRYCTTTPTLAAFWPDNYTLYKDGFLYNIWFGPTLEITTTEYHAPKDRRSLGGLIRTVEVTAGSGQLALPNLLQIGITLLLGAGGWSLIYSLRQSGWRSLLGAGLPLVGWLILNGWGPGRAYLAAHLELTLYVVIATWLALAAARWVGPLALTDLSRLRRAINQGRLAGPVRTVAIFPPGEAQTSRRLGWGLAAISLFVVLLGLVLSGVGETWWGWHRFSKLPLPLTLGLAGLAIFIAAGVFFYKYKKSPLEQFRFKNPYLGLALAGLFVTLIFFLLRTANSYGDSNELVNKLQLFLQYRIETGRSNFFIWREREPLDFALHFVLWRAMLRFDWWQPQFTYVIPAVLGGDLFVIITLKLAIMLTGSRLGRWLIAGLVLVSGSTLVFYGYIESYTLVALTSLIYLGLALLALRTQASIIWPSLALSLAILLHPQAVFLGPSLVVVLLVRTSFLRGKFNWPLLIRESGLAALVAGVTLACFGLLFIMYDYSWQQWGIAQKQFGGSDNGSFKPLLASAVRPGSREFYPVFSLDHLLYQFNLQSLIAPLALPLLSVSLGWRLLQKGAVQRLAGWWPVWLGIILFFGGLTWVGTQVILWPVFLGVALQLAGLWALRRRIIDLTGLLLATAALYTWLFSVAWNPDLGPNDWDLLSLNGIFTSLLAGYLISRYLENSRNFKPVVIVIIGCGIVLQMAWVLYNAFFIA